MVSGCIGLQISQSANVEMVLYPEICNAVPPKSLIPKEMLSRLKGQGLLSDK
jgi:hypothetical protein